MRTYTTLLATLAAASLLAGCGHESVDDGAVNFIRNANSGFDRFVLGATPEEQAFTRAHYWRMRGYPPFFDPALRWAPPTDFYKDLYALYPANQADEQILQTHPAWVLADASGNRLYVPFGCKRGRCPAFAADVGNLDYRAAWIAAARAELDKGYGGSSSTTSTWRCAWATGRERRWRRSTRERARR